jgi:modulator of FtsH protease
MALYDRDYAQAGTTGYESATRNEAQIVTFVKDTYKLFAASMMAGAVGADRKSVV